MPLGKRRHLSWREWTVDEVGDGVRYLSCYVLSYPEIIIFGHFLFTVRYSSMYIFSRTLDLGAFHLIFLAIELRHHLDGECQPDSVASLMRTNTHAWSAVVVN
jgi:hypothetical protein